MFLVFILVAAFVAVPTFAGPVPSKTAANQSLDQRAADIAVVRDVLSHDEVAKALEERGFTRNQVAQNRAQLQSAGLTRQEWLWVAIGAIAAMVLVIALS